MGSIRQHQLCVAALVGLAVGGLIYLLEREAGSASLMPLWLLSQDAPLASSWLGQHLPSFIHVFSFSLLTAWALHPWKGAPALACLGWVGVNLLFEAGQASRIAMVVSANFPAALERWPVVGNLDDYLAMGRFDPVDCIFVVLGGLAAWCWLLCAQSRGGEAC